MPQIQHEGPDLRWSQGAALDDRRRGSSLRNDVRAAEEALREQPYKRRRQRAQRAGQALVESKHGRAQLLWHHLHVQDRVCWMQSRHVSLYHPGRICIDSQQADTT